MVLTRSQARRHLGSLPIQSTNEARSRVFAIPELLEAILLNLPPRELLVVQQVSKQFQATINDSPKLQQALFFRPAPLRDPGSWTANPLLRDLFTPFFFIFEDTELNRIANGVVLMDWFTDEYLGHPRPRRNAMLRPNASWRRMLFIQPPPQRLSVVVIYERDGKGIIDRVRTVELSFDDKRCQGVTLSSLYDITVAFLSTYGRWSEFGVFIKESGTSVPEVTLFLRRVDIPECYLSSISQRGSLPERTWEGDINSMMIVEGEDYCGYSICRPTEYEYKGQTKMPPSWLDFSTDLTPERGGVTYEEYFVWVVWAMQKLKTEERKREDAAQGNSAKRRRLTRGHTTH